MLAGPVKIFPLEVAHALAGPLIEHTGSGLTVNVAALDVAVLHKLLNTAR
jgi:hypothetical protein